ncbi:MAG: phosphoenolpyruvate-utilizing N-terminal domain-containing protein, partial [candidate division Zixibacteria bacterium]
MKAVNKHKVIKGKPIAAGIVLGNSRVVLPGETQVVEIAVSDSALGAEINSLELAVKETVNELNDLRDSAIKKMGGPATKIFEAQLMIAQDKEFLGQVKKDIRSEKLNAAFVYNEHIKRATAPLKSSADTYIRQMALDIEAVAGRIISHLSGKTRKDHVIPPNTVLIGKSFTPGEVLSYRRQKVIGFVVAEGGPDSHMGLIARALYLPVVIAKDLKLSKLVSGQQIILDAIDGKIIFAPTTEEISDYQQRRKRMGPALITRIKHLKEIPPKTRDGVEIHVGGNMTLPGPAEEIMAEKNIPIGLYRSEFLYLAGGTFPDEETQFEHYAQVARKFAGSSVVIRTFDLGYDKMS